MLDPTIVHIVSVSIAFPKTISEMMTRTMVRRFPTDVMIGPQTPNRIYESDPNQTVFETSHRQQFGMSLP